MTFQPQHPPGISAKDGRGSIVPGFYCPACREDGNPMEDEVKLQFFTGPLPGYEAGRRVPVNVVVGGAHENKSTLLPPPFPELRTTTSDVPLRKPKWASSEKHVEMPANRPLQVPISNSNPLRNLALQNSDCRETTMPGGVTTSFHGVIGDGRSLASSLNNKGHLLKVQATPSRQSFSQTSLFSETSIHRSVQLSQLLKATDTHGFSDSSIGQHEVSETVPRVPRSRSFTYSNPSVLNDTDATVPRRVSKPVFSLTASLAKQRLDETTKQLAARPSPLPATATVNSIAPPVWKRGGLPFTAIPSKPSENVIPKNNSDGLFGSRFDPENFSLPFGVS